MLLYERPRRKIFSASLYFFSSNKQQPIKFIAPVFSFSLEIINLDKSKHFFTSLIFKYMYALSNITFVLIGLSFKTNSIIFKAFK